MCVQYLRLLGNFGVGFFSSFTAISFVDGLDLDKKLLAGVIGGTVTGGLAACKDLLEQLNIDAKPPKTRKGAVHLLRNPIFFVL